MKKLILILSTISTASIIQAGDFTTIYNYFVARSQLAGETVGTVLPQAPTESLIAAASRVAADEVINGFPRAYGIACAAGTVFGVVQKINETVSNVSTSIPTSSQSTPTTPAEQNKNINLRNERSDFEFQAEARIRHHVKSIEIIAMEYRSMYGSQAPADLTVLSINEMRLLAAAEESAASKRLIVNFNHFRRSYRALGTETN
jgi:hypothetical protein